MYVVQCCSGADNQHVSCEVSSVLPWNERVAIRSFVVCPQQPLRFFDRWNVGTDSGRGVSNRWSSDGVPGVLNPCWQSPEWTPFCVYQFCHIRSHEVCHCQILQPKDLSLTEIQMSSSSRHSSMKRFWNCQPPIPAVRCWCSQKPYPREWIHWIQPQNLFIGRELNICK